MAKEALQINIDMDKACPGCGHEGVSENGYCLKCNLKRYLAKTEAVISENVLNIAIEMLTKHLTEHHLEIDKSYRNLEEDDAGNKLEALSVSLKLKFLEIGNKVSVESQIGFYTGKVKDGNKVLIDPHQKKLFE